MAKRIAVPPPRMKNFTVRVLAGFGISKPYWRTYKIKGYTLTDALKRAGIK